MHGHCHQHAVMKFTAEKKLFKRLGLEFELLDSGCCGMAGSFGFEADHYEFQCAVANGCCCQPCENCRQTFYWWRMVLAAGNKCGNWPKGIRCIPRN